MLATKSGVHHRSCTVTAFLVKLSRFYAQRLFPAATEFDIPPRCERCGELENRVVIALPFPTLRQLPPIAPGKQTVKLHVEKRQKGKHVTVVRGLDELDLPDLLVKLKNSCGAGGTIKEQAIEIQGQHAERIRLLLKELGFRVK